MAHYRGMRVGRGAVSGKGRGGWEAGGGLNPPLGLFGLAMSPIVPAIGLNMLECRKRHLHITGVNFKPISSM